MTRDVAALHIRPRVSEDHPDLARIWLDAARTTERSRPDADLPQLHPVVLDGWLPSLTVWVATDSMGEPSGFIGLRGHEVRVLYVHPSVQRHGIGRALLAHAGQRLGPLCVGVDAQNTTAQAFFRRCGLVETCLSGKDDRGQPMPVLHLTQMLP